MKVTIAKVYICGFHLYGLLLSYTLLSPLVPGSFRVGRQSWPNSRSKRSLLLLYTSRNCVGSNDRQDSIWPRARGHCVLTSNSPSPSHGGVGSGKGRRGCKRREWPRTAMASGDLGELGGRLQRKACGGKGAATDLLACVIFGR